MSVIISMNSGSITSVYGGLLCSCTHFQPMFWMPIGFTNRKFELVDEHG
jgi:hypothetical protein